MALIPNAQGAELSRKAIVLDLGDLERQADWLKEQAEKAAEEHIIAARQERERILAGAHEEGHAAGHQEGYEAGLSEGREAGRAEALEERRAQIDALTASWEAALATFEAVRLSLQSDAREDLLRLALRIASRVVRRQIECDTNVVLEQLEAAIGMTMGATRLVIEINESDRETVESSLGELMRRLNQSSETDVLAVPDVEAGGCRIRTSHGVIDAGIDVQLDRMMDLLLPNNDGSTPEADPEASV